MKKLLGFYGLFLIWCTSLMLAGCSLYPDGDTRIEDLDMVATYFDNKASFSNYKTYSIADAVRPISANKLDSPGDIDNSLSNLIISIIDENMQTMGYEKVDTSDKPDLAINVGGAVTSKIVITNYYPYYYYWNGGYWVEPGYWWGYYDYGYYYGWYPADIVSSYEVGTLIIDMIDLKNKSTMQNSKLNVVWTAALRGIISASQASNRSRAKENIDQAFKQSPYLQDGGGK